MSAPLHDRRVAVVLGGASGPGLEAVRGLCEGFGGEVVFTGDDATEGERAVARLAAAGLRAYFRAVNACDHAQREAFGAHVRARYAGGVDALVNGLDARPGGGGHSDADRTLAANFFGALFMCHVLFPLLRRHARVLHLTAACGRLTNFPPRVLRAKFAKADLTAGDLLGLLANYRRNAARYGESATQKWWGNDSYCVAKVAVAALAFAQQREMDARRPGQDVVVNCLCAGEEARPAAANVVRLATLPHFPHSPVGKFLWSDLSVVDWHAAADEN